MGFRAPSPKRPLRADEHRGRELRAEIVLLVNLENVAAFPVHRRAPTRVQCPGPLGKLFLRSTVIITPNSSTGSPFPFPCPLALFGDLLDEASSFFQHLLLPSLFPNLALSAPI